jgi:hypothetical protein
VRLDHLLQVSLAHGTRSLLHHPAIFEKQYRGDAADMVPHRGLQIGSHVHLADFGTPGMLGIGIGHASLDPVQAACDSDKVKPGPAKRESRP